MLNIFGKRKPLAGLEHVGVDMHSHLIPGVDDGVQNIDESLESVKILYEAGYHHLITTPHIMSDYYPNTPDNLRQELEKLRKAIADANLPVTVDIAAEYYLDYPFYENFERQELLAINGKYLLFELSFLNPPEILKEIIFRMQTAGYKPVMAHPERYSYWFRNFEMFRDLKDRGVWLQLNINSFADEYGVPTRKLAEKLIKEDMADLLGTDFHRPAHAASMQKALYNKYLQQFIQSDHLKNHTLAD